MIQHIYEEVWQFLLVLLLAFVYLLLQFIYRKKEFGYKNMFSISNV